MGAISSRDFRGVRSCGAIASGDRVREGVSRHERDGAESQEAAGRYVAMTNDLQQARIEAEMRACVLSPEIPTGQRAHLVHLEGVLTIREQVDLEVVVEKVLAAADAHLPTVEKISEVVAREVIRSVGECICHEAWTMRNMRDPSCEWHNLGEGFPDDVAHAVRALFGEVAGDEV